MLRSRHRVIGRRQKRIETLSRQGWRVWAIIAGVLLAVWGTAAWFAISEERKERASDNLPEIALEAGETFVYDLARLESRQTRFFTYPTSSSERSRLLVQRDADGAIRTAFASCIACYSHRRDHKLNKGHLICGKCQSAMRIGDQNERLTSDKSCVAVPVPFSLDNNKVIVRPQVITAGLQNFSNSNKSADQRDGDSKDPQSRP